MNLVETLDLTLPAFIAITGGGGKTTALFQIARQIKGRVWVTTTTHLGTDQLHFADKHLIIKSPGEIDYPNFGSQKVTLVTGPFTPDDRVKGPSIEVLEALRLEAVSESVSLVVEADGSRSHPIKAPAQHEPVIPEWMEMVIVVVGLSALGKPFTPDWVHRPEQFEQLTGLKVNQAITIESLGRLLINPQGGLKNIPAKAVKVALLNQADTGEQQQKARQIIPILLQAGYDKVIIGTLKNAPDALEGYQTQ